MRRSLTLAALAVATTLTAAACGGGGGAAMTQGATTGGAAGAPAGQAAPGQPMQQEPMASGSGDMQGGGDMQDGDMAGGDMGGANEMGGDQEDMLPKGTSLTKAKAAGLGTDGAPVVAVVGNDTTCKANKMSVPAGNVWFQMTNKGGMKINELYLEDAKAKELIQVEGLKNGQSGAFKFKVKPGKYLLACEPGGQGKQIRVALTVTEAMM